MTVGQMIVAGAVVGSAVVAATNQPSTPSLPEVTDPVVDKTAMQTEEDTKDATLGSEEAKKRKAKGKAQFQVDLPTPVDTGLSSGTGQTGVQL